MKWEYGCMEQLRLGPKLWAQGQSYEKCFSFAQCFPLSLCVMEWEKEKERQKKVAQGFWSDSSMNWLYWETRADDPELQDFSGF